MTPDILDDRNLSSIEVMRATIAAKITELQRQLTKHEETIAVAQLVIERHTIVSEHLAGQIAAWQNLERFLHAEPDDQAASVGDPASEGALAAAAAAVSTTPCSLCAPAEGCEGSCGRP
jgi:hypothetical protein